MHKAANNGGKHPKDQRRPTKSQAEKIDMILKWLAAKDVAGVFQQLMMLMVMSLPRRW